MDYETSKLPLFMLLDILRIVKITLNLYNMKYRTITQVKNVRSLLFFISINLCLVTQLKSYTVNASYNLLRKNYPHMYKSCR